MRIAVVAVGDADQARARIAAAVATGAAISVVAPPSLAAALALPSGARWAKDGELDQPASVPALRAAGAARDAVKALLAEGPLDEVRFAAVDAAGWATALEGRQGGLGALRVVVEVAARDANLAGPLALGATLADRLFLDAVRSTLRDADEVTGDAEALRALAKAGWVLGTPRAEPAWPEGGGPKISVVVTHKDLGAFLPECLASLRAQTTPLEIVLVDDGSGPEGLAVVAAEEERDPSLRIIRQANAGLSAARNRGAEEASGELIAFVDADNVLRPRFIERLAQALRFRPAASYAVPAFRAFDGERTLWLYCPSELSPATLLMENTGGDACALHHRESFLGAGGFAVDEPLQEDWDLWLTYARLGLHGAVVPEVLFDYRVRGDSMVRALPALRLEQMPFRAVSRHLAGLEPWADEWTRLAAARAHGVSVHLSGLDRELRAQFARAGELERLAAGGQELAKLREEESVARGVEVARVLALLELEKAESKRLAGLEAQERERAARAEALAEQVQTASALHEARGAKLSVEVSRLEAELSRLEAELSLQQGYGEQLLASSRRLEQLAVELRGQLQAARAESARLAGALEDLASSSSVRLARWVHGLSPTAHKTAGTLARTVLALPGKLRGKE